MWVQTFASLMTHSACNNSARGRGIALFELCAGVGRGTMGVFREQDGVELPARRVGWVGMHGASAALQWLPELLDPPLPGFLLTSPLFHCCSLYNCWSFRV